MLPFSSEKDAIVPGACLIADRKVPMRPRLLRRLGDGLADPSDCPVLQLVDDEVLDGRSDVNIRPPSIEIKSLLLRVVFLPF